MVYKQTFFFSLLVITLMISDSISKSVLCRTKFNEKDNAYCSKFGAHKASQVIYTVRARFLQPYRHGSTEKTVISLGIYRDDLFDEIISSNGQKGQFCGRDMDDGVVKEIIQLPYDGSWSEKTQHVLYNRNIPRIFHFVALDCNHNTHKRFGDMPRIEMQIEMLNGLNDQDIKTADHFSYEESGLVTLNTYILIVNIVLFAFAIYSYREHNNQFLNQNSPHMLILFSIFFHLGAIILQLFHLWMYASNGKGIPVFDIFSNIGQMISEIIYTCMLLMIANGWTLTYEEIDIDNNLDVYLPIGTIVFVVHLILAALTYIDIDSHHKYHDYSGVQGWVLVVLKLCLLAYFIYMAAKSKKDIGRQSLEFYTTFLKMGILYLLAIPLTILSSFFLQPFERQYYFTFMTNTVQLVAIAVMIQQQSSTKSSYFKASVSGRGVLPMEKIN